jgi:hypothetical protein
LSVRTELLAPPTPLSSMHTRTQAKEPAAPDQTLLVLLAQTGDRAALEQLLRDSYAPLRRYVTGLIGATLADDILQETSLQIFRKLPTCASPPSSAPGPSGSLRVLPSHISNAPVVGNPSTTHALHTSQPSTPLSASYPTRPSSLSSTRSRLPAEPSSFSTTSTTSRSKRVQPSSRFRLAPPSHASTTESPLFANTSPPKGTQHEPRTPAA